MLCHDSAFPGRAKPNLNALAPHPGLCRVFTFPPGRAVLHVNPAWPKTCLQVGEVVICAKPGRLSRRLRDKEALTPPRPKLAGGFGLQAAGLSTNNLPGPRSPATNVELVTEPIDKITGFPGVAHRRRRKPGGASTSCCILGGTGFKCASTPTGPDLRGQRTGRQVRSTADSGTSIGCRPL